MDKKKRNRSRTSKQTIKIQNIGFLNRCSTRHSLGGIRIIGGIWRGRRLFGPMDAAIRPTANRTRTGLFDILAHAFIGELGLERQALGLDPAGSLHVWSVPILDACCGTGSLGLEALSRGACWVSFLDHAPAALMLVQRNLDALGGLDRADWIQADICRLPLARRVYGLMLFDPPYAEAACLIRPALENVAEGGWLLPGALIVIEGPKSLMAGEGIMSLLPPNFTLLQKRRYGAAWIVFLRWHKDQKYKD